MSLSRVEMNAARGKYPEVIANKYIGAIVMVLAVTSRGLAQRLDCRNPRFESALPVP